MPSPLNERKANNWDSLRLLAAAWVIFIHSFAFTGSAIPFFYQTEGVIRLGQVGVYVFFTISGFLISSSWIRKPEVISFYRNRILRIFPALITVVLFTVFIVGPLFTSWAMKDYFTSRETYEYLWNISLWKTVFYLPGVFPGHEVNAPLWTLFFEFLMYISVALFGLAGWMNEKYKSLYLLLFFILFSLIPFTYQKHLFFLKVNISNLIVFAAFFYAGVIFNLYGKSISGMKVLMGATLLFIPFVLYFGKPAVFPYLLLLLSTGSVMIGSMNKAWLPFITRFGDFSYGFYIYGYVIQNILSVLFPVSNPYLFALLSLLFTAPFAIFSWKVVEQPFLRLKK